MKKVLAAFAVLALVGTVGCGSEQSGSGERGQGGQQGSDQGGQSGEEHGDKEADKGDADGGGTASETAKLGEPLELSGDESGSEFEVGVVTVQDPSETVQKKAEKGTRYVSARVAVENTGDIEVAGDTVDDGIELRTEDGRIYQADTKLSHPAGEKSDQKQLGERAKPLAPGDTADRWVAFLVDGDKKPAAIVLGSGSPFTDKDASWTLR